MALTTACSLTVASQAPDTQDVQLTRDRAVAALLGSFVADAACMGAHWLGHEQIAQLLAERGTQCQPEFLDPPCSKKVCRKRAAVLTEGA